MNLVKGQAAPSRFGGMQQRKSKSSTDLLYDDTESESESMDQSTGSSHSQRSLLVHPLEADPAISEISRHMAKKKKKSSKKESSRSRSLSRPRVKDELSGSRHGSTHTKSRDDLRGSSRSRSKDELSGSRHSSTHTKSRDDPSTSSPRHRSKSSSRHHDSDHSVSSTSRSSKRDHSVSSRSTKGDDSSSRHSRSSRSNKDDSSHSSRRSRSSSIVSNNKGDDDLSRSLHKLSKHGESSSKDKKKSRSSSSTVSSKGSTTSDKEGRSRRHRSKLRKSSEQQEDGGDDLEQLHLAKLSQHTAVIREEQKRLTWAVSDDPEGPPDRIAQVVFSWENENHPDMWWNQKELEMNLRDCMRVVASMRTSKPGKAYVKAVTRLYHSYKKTSTDTKSSKALQVVAKEPHARGLELHIGFLLRGIKSTHIKKVVETQTQLKAAAVEGKSKSSSSIQSQIRKESLKHSRPCRQFAFMIAQYDAHAALKASLSSWVLDDDE